LFVCKEHVLKVIKNLNVPHICETDKNKNVGIVIMLLNMNCIYLISGISQKIKNVQYPIGYVIFQKYYIDY
jgi:hypothetical protein